MSACAQLPPEVSHERIQIYVLGRRADAVGAVVTGAAPGLAFDQTTLQHRIDKAIQDGDYETADRLLGDRFSEGGLGLDSILLKRALVNAKARRYAESIGFIDQLLRDYPTCVYRERALALRRWVEGQQENR